MDSKREMVLRGKVVWQGERTPADDFGVYEVQARVVENDISKYFAVRAAFRFGVAYSDEIEGPYTDHEVAKSVALRMQADFIGPKEEKPWLRA